MAQALYVRGLRETQRTLRAIDKSLPKVINNELKKVGQPIAETVREKLAQRFQGVSTNRIRPVVLTGRLLIRQTAGKKTGLRSDFGRTQMRYGFEPALADWEPRLPALVGAALDRMVEEAP